MEYVQTARELEALAAAIEGAELIAVDTEAAGYHRYHDRVCLLQLSTRKQTFVVDTLGLTELDALAAPLASLATETVLHDADYDLRLLSRDFGLRVTGLFDTKIAAQFLGESAIGLAGLAEKYLGVQLEKKHQRADWAQRPLPADMLAYAAEDTRHLPALRDALREALAAAGRLAWAEEEFSHQEQVQWGPEAPDPDAYLRLKNARDLKGRQLAALRELYEWREAEARERDVAPFRVIGNDVLVAVARALPRNPAALSALREVPGSIADRRGRELLAAVDRAMALAEADLPARPRGPGRPLPDPAFEAAVERLKTARDRAAESLAVDRGFLMPRYQLEIIARARPGTLEELAAVAEVRRWQVEALGSGLLKAVRAA
jgi:ribonuclease D